MPMERKSRKPCSEAEALQKLEALCATTEHCRADMLRKMNAWEVADEARDRIIQRLEEGHFIDEARYARAFVRDKFRYNHWGTTRIAMEMRRKGIPGDIIESALHEIAEEDVAGTLTRLLQAKLRTTKGSNEHERVMKVLRFAVGKGYALRDIRECMAAMLDETARDTLETLEATDEDR